MQINFTYAGVWNETFQNMYFSQYLHLNVRIFLEIIIYMTIFIINIMHFSVAHLLQQ